MSADGEAQEALVNLARDLGLGIVGGPDDVRKAIAQKIENMRGVADGLRRQRDEAIEKHRQFLPLAFLLEVDARSVLDRCIERIREQTDQMARMERIQQMQLKEIMRLRAEDAMLFHQNAPPSFH